MYDEAENAFRTHWDDTAGHAGWQNEYWGKTMLCIAGAIEYEGDRELAAWALAKANSFIDGFQKPNGYLSTYSNEDFLRDNPGDTDAKRHFCHNIWGRKYTLWALVALHRATGDARCLEAAGKMARHLAAQLRRLGIPIERTGSWNGISSMSVLKPLCELIRIDDRPEYRELAAQIAAAASRDSGNPCALLANARRPGPIASWFPEPAFWAKSYEIMSCLEGLLDWHRLAGDSDILNGVLAFYRHILDEERNPMRGVGLFDHFLGARSRANGMVELCDVVHWIRLNRELLLLTGEAQYAERIEEAFCNAFLAGVWRDGRWGAHVVRSHGTRHLRAPSQTGMTHHQCCPDNMMRTFFDIAATAILAEPDGSLSVALYFDADAEADGASVSIRGGYPWGDGTVTVTVRADRPRRVRFRVPSWSHDIFRADGPCFQSGGAEAQRTSGSSLGSMTFQPEFQNGWLAALAPAGTTSYALSFDFTPRIESFGPDFAPLPPSPQPGNSVTDIGIYTVHFMEWMTPDMAGMCREMGGATIMRGPLVLAKGRLAGTSRDETFSAATIRCGGWNASLAPLPPTAANAGVNVAWRLVLENADTGERREMPVSDFASVSNIDDPENWFSLWF